MSDTYVLLGDNIWQQNLDSDDFLLCNNKHIPQECAASSYLKLSKKHPLNDWDSLAESSAQFYEMILSCIN